MGKKEEEVIELKPINIQFMDVTIEGDGDLVLNKMNDVCAKSLIDIRKDKAKDMEKPNMWEEVITSLHWFNGKPETFTEESLAQCLDPKNNAPCITAFGLKKSYFLSMSR